MSDPSPPAPEVLDAIREFVRRTVRGMGLESAVEAHADADGTLLVNITGPDAGEVIGPSGKVINAMVPLGEMFGYATTLRSMSQGRATFTMEFDHYAEAPNSIAEAVIKKS